MRTASTVSGPNRLKRAYTEIYIGRYCSLQVSGDAAARHDRCTSGDCAVQSVSSQNAPMCKIIIIIIMSMDLQNLNPSFRTEFRFKILMQRKYFFQLTMRTLRPCFICLIYLVNFVPTHFSSVLCGGGNRWDAANFVSGARNISFFLGK